MISSEIHMSKVVFVSLPLKVDQGKLCEPHDLEIPCFLAFKLYSSWSRSCSQPGLLSTSANSLWEIVKEIGDERLVDGNLLVPSSI